MIQVINFYLELVYWCTVHVEPVMNHAGVTFCPCPTPIFKVYIHISVSLKLCSDWMVNLLKINFNFVHTRTNRQIDLIDC